MIREALSCEPPSLHHGSAQQLLVHVCVCLACCNQNPKEKKRNFLCHHNKSIFIKMWNSSQKPLPASASLGSGRRVSSLRSCLASVARHSMESASQRHSTSSSVVPASSLRASAPRTQQESLPGCITGIRPTVPLAQPHESKLIAQFADGIRHLTHQLVSSDHQAQINAQHSREIHEEMQPRLLTIVATLNQLCEEKKRTIDILEHITASARRKRMRSKKEQHAVPAGIGGAGAVHPPPGTPKSCAHAVASYRAAATATQAPGVLLLAARSSAPVTHEVSSVNTNALIVARKLAAPRKICDDEFDVFAVG